MQKVIPTYSGTLRSHSLEVPDCIAECSGIRIFGRRIKSLVFSTDVAIIKNVNADAIIAVYPFTPQPSIAQAIINVSDVPVLVDFDEGYGDSPLQVYHNVERLVRAGAKGFTLDDGMGIRGWQRLDYAKRHGGGRAYEVFPTEHWLAKVKAALAALEGTDCLLIARTECRPNDGLEEAIERCARAADLGAPMTLINRMYNIEECQQVAQRLPGWKMYPDVISNNGVPEVELEEEHLPGCAPPPSDGTLAGAMAALPPRYREALLSCLTQDPPEGSDAILTDFLNIAAPWAELLLDPDRLAPFRPLSSNAPDRFEKPPAPKPSIDNCLPLLTGVRALRQSWSFPKSLLYIPRSV